MEDFMSVTSVSSTAGGLQNIDSNQFSAFKQRRQDFQALAQALGSGDLTGAQKAFAAFQQDMQTIRQSRAGQQSQTGQQSSQTSVKDAIDALGKALSAGDLSGAQKALDTLKQDFQSMAQSKAHGHHHHRHTDSAQSASGANAPTATGSAAPTTGINTTA
jgi:hypothetical protein